MSDRIEERRTQEVLDQKKLQNQKTEKEKEAAAQKFKQTMGAKTTAQQKNETTTKNQQQQKGFNQSLFMSRQGIANRSQAEQLMKRRDDTEKSEKDNVGSRDKDMKADVERRENDAVEAKDEALHDSQQAQQFDAPVKNDDDKNREQQSQSQGQNQGGAGQQSAGKQNQQDQQQQQNDDRSIGAVGGGKIGGAQTSGADETKSATKIAIGKSQQAAASERIPQPVMQKLVDQVSTMSTQGMNEFQIQLKDDALGGGTLRVSIDKDKKLKIAFTMKDRSAKNLLESSKGVFMRMFEKKGMKLESFDVKVRGEA